MFYQTYRTLQHTEELEQIPVEQVIGCQGQAGSGSMSESPLLAGLIWRGLARPAIAGFGIEVAADCALIDAEGRAQDRLLAVGPLTIGTFLETVAIPTPGHRRAIRLFG